MKIELIIVDEEEKNKALEAAKALTQSLKFPQSSKPLKTVEINSSEPKLIVNLSRISQLSLITHKLVLISIYFLIFY